jgi:hypothetical protein
MREAISFPYRHTIYDYCGPEPPHFQNERGGPRCDRCRGLMKETGENHYCAKVIPVAYYWEKAGMPNG